MSVYSTCFFIFAENIKTLNRQVDYEESKFWIVGERGTVWGSGGNSPSALLEGSHDACIRFPQAAEHHRESNKGRNINGATQPETTRETVNGKQKVRSSHMIKEKKGGP